MTLSLQDPGLLARRAPIDGEWIDARDGATAPVVNPATGALLASVPRLDRVSDDELQAIPGNPPNLLELPAGCRFHDRCNRAAGPPPSSPSCCAGSTS